MGGARGNNAERCEDLVLVNWETDYRPWRWQIWQRGAQMDMAGHSGGDQTGATVTVQMVVAPQLTSAFEVHPASSVTGSKPVSSDNWTTPVYTWSACRRPQIPHNDNGLAATSHENTAFADPLKESLCLPQSVHHRYSPPRLLSGGQAYM